MTKNEAIDNLYNGQLVQCTKEEYRAEIRLALQDYAAKQIDNHQDMRAIIALEEVKRLDTLFNFRLAQP